MYSLETGVFIYRYSMNDLPDAFNGYSKRRFNVHVHSYQTRHIDHLTNKLK